MGCCGVNALTLRSLPPLPYRMHGHTIALVYARAHTQKKTRRVVCRKAAAGGHKRPFKKGPLVSCFFSVLV